MHRHDHEHSEAEQDTAARSRAEAPDPLLMKAAAAGRTDVLGARGMTALQRAAGNGAAATVAGEEERSPVLDVLSSSGSALDEPVRQDMEARMGHDFSDVRVHTGDAADKSAKSVSAHAYTVGSNIVFQRGTYDPDSSAGKTLLAHELTHVVQQRSGPVEGTSQGNGVQVSDPSDRFEREASANADAVMAKPAPVQAATAAAPAPVAAVQRHAGHEEEVQASHDSSLPAVQREGDEEEEVQGSHDPSQPAVQREGDEEESEEA
ncbi:DUF4157 domain-containing protein [Nocardioides speluncae]|uniref:eCIS core domain-containing protein n=1 Tax=Nocardioides speluncae TaxID=2670337 RepID=UPI000D68ADE8|nr:DUF4157 domain-containing protein [Nocardioides speluncae]